MTRTLILGSNRARVRRFGSCHLPAAAAALDEERQKKNHVNREDCEEDLFEPFAPIKLWVAD
jgi:hypothetical protein